MASVYPKSFLKSNFVLQPDGRYKATLLASVHGLGTNYHVCKKIVRDEDGVTWHNQLAEYKILENGDLEYYADEPCVCKVFLEGE